jgi:hypothetical protein
VAFVLMHAPKLPGTPPFAAPIAAVDMYEDKGFKLVAGRDKDKNPKDIRPEPASFTDEVLAAAQGTDTTTATPAVTEATR